MVPVVFSIFFLSHKCTDRNWSSCLSTTTLKAMSVLPTLLLRATLLPTALPCVPSRSCWFPNPTSPAIVIGSGLGCVTQVWPVRALSPEKVSWCWREDPHFLSLVKFWDVSPEAAGDPADIEGIYKESIRLKTEMRSGGTVLVASEDLVFIPGLQELALAFRSLISHLVL